MSFWVLIILTVLFWGAAPILDKLALEKANPFQGVVIRSMVIIVVLLSAVLFTGKFKEIFNIDSKTFLLFGSSGILAGLLGVLTYYAALRIGPASKVVPLAAVYPMVAVLLSILFLKESVTMSRVLGTIFVILGIWFLK